MWPEVAYEGQAERQGQLLMASTTASLAIGTSALILSIVPSAGLSHSMAVAMSAGAWVVFPMMPMRAYMAATRRDKASCSSRRVASDA